MNFFSFLQLVEAPSLSEGLRQLQFDNKTESVNTINILHRWDSLQLSFHIFRIHPTVHRFRLASKVIFGTVWNVMYLQVQCAPRGCACRTLQHLLVSALSHILLHLRRLCPSGFHHQCQNRLLILHDYIDIFQHKSFIFFSSRGSFWVPCTL